MLCRRLCIHSFYNRHFLEVSNTSSVNQIEYLKSQLACDAVATRVPKEKQSDKVGWCASTTAPQAVPESRFWCTGSI